jgi:hypothetical protein
VWDPVTGDQRCVALPPGFDQNDDRLAVRGGALLCCGGHASEVPIESFKVVVLRTDDALLDADPHAFASALSIIRIPVCGTTPSQHRSGLHFATGPAHWLGILSTGSLLVIIRVVELLSLIWTGTV